MGISPGRYYIVSTVISKQHGPLALQYLGENANVIVIPFGSGCGTVWKLTRYEDGTQTILPDGHSNIEAVNIGDVLRTSSSTRGGWGIDMSWGQCTVHDGDHSVYWNINVGSDGPVPGEHINIIQGDPIGVPGPTPYQWMFLSVPDS